MMGEREIFLLYDFLYLWKFECIFYFKNKDKFDAETFTPKQSALWQGKFLIVSNPEGLSWLKT